MKTVEELNQELLVRLAPIEKEIREIRKEYSRKLQELNQKKIYNTYEEWWNFNIGKLSCSTQYLEPMGTYARATVQALIDKLESDSMVSPMLNEEFWDGYRFAIGRIKSWLRDTV